MTNEFDYDCSNGYAIRGMCYRKIDVTNASCGNSTSEVIANSTNNETECNAGCIESMNSSNVCVSSCPDFYYPQIKYGSCLACQTDEYDGGTFWSRNLGKCVSSCKYVNNMSIAISSNSSVPYALGCEDILDPPDPAHCPYYQYINSTAYLCTSSCSVLVQNTRVCCPSGAPLVASVGSIICQTSCSSSIYLLVGTSNVCNDTCQLPYGI